MIAAPEWRVSADLTPYLDAVAAMEARVESIRAGTDRELIWLVEHPPLYTAGVSARPEELLDPNRFPVFATGRGGKHTYHGPGQRVIYAMIDLDRRNARDLHGFIYALEEWIIAALAALGVDAGRVAGRTGVWTDGAKLAAIGVRVRRWVTYHGAAINIAPCLEHFSGIVPCGIDDAQVTSLAALGFHLPLSAVDSALLAALPGFVAAVSERFMNPAGGETVLPHDARTSA